MRWTAVGLALATGLVLVITTGPIHAQNSSLIGQQMSPTQPGQYETIRPGYPAQSYPPGSGYPLNSYPNGYPPNGYPQNGYPARNGYPPAAGYPQAMPPNAAPNWAAGRRQTSFQPMIPAPLPPREIQIHDIVSVRVDILARMQADGELKRRKNAKYDAQLKDWIFLEGLRAIRPSPQSLGDQKVGGTLKSDYRSLGEVQSRESLVFNLASEIVDIRPNGNLVIEGRSKVVLNDEMWTYVLSGVCRPEAIGPDNVVLSRDIVNLDIRKVETGSVAAGYQRGWFQKLFDLVQPF